MSLPNLLFSAQRAAPRARPNRSGGSIAAAARLLGSAIWGVVLAASPSQATDRVPPSAADQVVVRQGLPLQTLAQVDCPNFARLANDYQSRFQAPMRTWSIENLSRLGTRTVVYPFSGPDVITPLSLFGSADRLILVADQNPELTVTTQAETHRIQKECQTKTYFARLGYFRTNDLEGKGSIRPRFTKMLVYSILISGSRIDRVVPLRITAQGGLEEVDPQAPIRHDGLRLQITTASRRPVTVDYLRINLSNAGLKAQPTQAHFLAENMAATVFIKSASHLLQKANFSMLAEMISNKAKAVVQDETGLDIERIRQHFRVDAYGRFNGPHPLWKDSVSSMRLKDFLSAQPALTQLPFVMGYEKPMGSILLVAHRARGPAQ